MDWLKNFLMNNGISGDDAEVATYGIYRAMLLMAGIMVALILGRIFGSVKHTICFLVFFMPLRVFAGGYHADSLWKCGILSSVIVILANLFLNITLHSYGEIMFAIIVITSVIHFSLVPQDNSARRLFSWEKLRFKKISYCIICVYTILAFVSLMLKWNFMLQTICIVMILSGFSLLVAYFLNHKIERETKK